MASLLIVRLGGDIVGHCDALCYLARHDVCTCICGGANHRAGLEQAIANTRALHTEWLERARGDAAIDVEIDDSVQHLPLFPL
ncbi:hypothetical protein [Spirillospora sp. NBC_01491]|uniref:hypothetical protein n=1 Tax=Spirillospora sp. NBC_01491 TaxID=2976007 RepID=UPI002E366F14|nr:hypothetical protein [Spirillospora sp. NBC_01491]